MFETEIFETLYLILEPLSTPFNTCGNVLTQVLEATTFCHTADKEAVIDLHPNRPLLLHQLICGPFIYTFNFCVHNSTFIQNLFVRVLSIVHVGGDYM